MEPSSELVPSSSVQKGSTEYNRAQEFIEKEKSEIIQKAERYQGEVTNLNTWTSVKEEAEVRLTELFSKKAGVQLNKEDFSQVFFVPMERLKELVGQIFDGRYFQKASIIVVGVPKDTSEENYSSLVTVYHELLHSVMGSKITAVGKEKKFGFLHRKRKKVVRITTAQAGFITEGAEIRGNGLEEAVAHYYSEEALLNSTSPEIIDIKKRFLCQFIKQDLQGEGSDFIRTINEASDGQFIEIESNLRPNLRTGYGERSNACQNMLETLLSRAQSAGKLKEYEEVLLQAKVDGSKRRKLFDMTKEIIGDRDVARRVFKVSTKDVEGIFALTDSIKILPSNIQG